MVSKSQPRPRLLTPPKSSFFLFGARGTGKSTWTRAALSHAERFDLLDEGLVRDFLANPSLFGSALRALERGTWVVIDEVQRIPSLLNEVHRAIEELSLRFALLGSSARKLKTAGTNLLAGRALWKTMFPFVPQELGTDFDLEATLRFGSIPLVVTAEDPEQSLEAYVQLYLREEIRGEALVRNLPGFVRFLPIAAVAHGQVINVAGIARDSGTARATVQGYLEILEDTLLGWRLPAFEPKLRVRERKHPKLYWLDPGLVRAVKRRRGEVIAEERGALFEGWIHMVLRAQNQIHPLFDEIAYWSPAEARGTEVDFVLERGGEHLAIEVKSGTRFDSSELAGLRAIAELPRLARRVVIYNGPRALKTEDGIEVWPLGQFLDALATQTLWP